MADFPMELVEPVLGPRPDGRPAQMRQMADAHAASAERSRELAQGYRDSAGSSRSALGGDTGAQVASYQERIATALDNQADYSDSLAQQLYQGANTVEEGQFTWEGMGVVLVAQLAADALMLQAGAVKSVEDRAAARVGWRRFLGDRLTGLVTSGRAFMATRAGMLTMAGALGAAAGAVVPLVAEERQIWAGHRQHLDGQTIVTGMVSGLAGGLGGAAVASAAAPTVQRWLGRMVRGPRLSAVLGTLTLGAAGGAGGAIPGVLAGSLTTAAYTGKFSLSGRDLMNNLTIGIAGGMVGGVTHVVHAGRTSHPLVEFPAAQPVPDTLDAAGLSATGRMPNFVPGRDPAARSSLSGIVFGSSGEIPGVRTSPNVTSDAVVGASAEPIVRRASGGRVLSESDIAAHLASRGIETAPFDPESAARHEADRIAAASTERDRPLVFDPSRVPGANRPEVTTVGLGPGERVPVLVGAGETRLEGTPALSVTDGPASVPLGRNVDGPWGRTPDGPLGRTPDGSLGRTPDGSLGRTPEGSMDRNMDGPLGRTPDGTAEPPGNRANTPPVPPSSPAMSAGGNGSGRPFGESGHGGSEPHETGRGGGGFASDRNGGDFATGRGGDSGSGRGSGDFASGRGSGESGSGGRGGDTGGSAANAGGRDPGDRPHGSFEYTPHPGGVENLPPGLLAASADFAAAAYGFGEPAPGLTEPRPQPTRRSNHPDRDAAPSGSGPSIRDRGATHMVGFNYPRHEQNRAALLLARAGYEIRHLPSRDAAGRPTGVAFDIEGRPFGFLRAETSSAANIVRRLTPLGERVVVSLRDSPLSPRGLAEYLNYVRPDHVSEVIVVDENQGVEFARLLYSRDIQPSVAGVRDALTRVENVQHMVIDTQDPAGGYSWGAIRRALPGDAQPELFTRTGSVLRPSSPHNTLLREMMRVDSDSRFGSGEVTTALVLDEREAGRSAQLSTISYLGRIPGGARIFDIDGHLVNYTGVDEFGNERLVRVDGGAVTVAELTGALPDSIETTSAVVLHGGAPVHGLGLPYEPADPMAVGGTTTHVEPVTPMRGEDLFNRLADDYSPLYDPELVHIGSAHGHDRWRFDLPKTGDGRYEQVWAPTTDERWLAAHEDPAHPGHVDLANTDYWHLPADAQRNCQLSVEVALEVAAQLHAAGVDLRDPQAREAISDVVHEAWMSRKYRTARPDQLLPYWPTITDETLTEAERDKDRVYADIAIDLVRSSVQP
ncbi:hypothetical protein [Nocardia sp. BMG111209]|uniref:hypothetical protein n=1 Tax=Nocardia sp. BMG111209 TaxID=1160137 RepID=UPI00039C083A|nr:hypothetical protein [Nocardia sp. BMG111209]